MKTILVVDDEPRTRLGIQKTLVAWAAGRYRIEVAASGVEALEWLRENKAQILITDVRMPEVNGLQMLEELAVIGQKPVVIVISGYAEFEYAKKSLQLGAFDYLLKPLDKSVLVDAVQRAIALDTNKERIEVMEKLVDPKLLEVSREEARYGPSIKSAIAYIDEHLHEPISMKGVAEQLHLNASYFSVLFKGETGVTFSDYLTLSRLQRAKELLVATRMPVGEIADKVGYQTDKYFAKVFKDNVGISPGQYRQQALNSDSPIQ
jgi:YesN/AraC family two-component response regulator